MAVESESVRPKADDVWEDKKNPDVTKHVTAVGRESVCYVRLGVPWAPEYVMDLATWLHCYRRIGHWDAARGVVVREEVRNGS